MRHIHAAVFALLFAASALAQTSSKPGQRFKFVPPTLKQGGEITWTMPPGAHQEWVRDEYVILYPSVEIDYQDIKVHADKITANLKTKDVVAEGHVVIDQGPQRISGSHAVFNLDSKTGTFFEATAALQPTMYFEGEKIEKVGDQSYRLTNGVLTSCDLESPAWSFHVKRADITVDDYAHMQDVSLRAKRLPLIWLPRLVFPTKKDRAKGFLIPRYLHSGQLGDRFEFGYFLPIGDSVDITAYADLNTKNFNGFGVDLRYLPTPNVKLGELNVYTVHNPDPDPNVVGEKARQEWRYEYRHSQENLPWGFRGVVDVQDYSDLDFFRRYDRDPRLHTLSNVYSSAYLTKNRPTYSFNLLADRRDIFLGHLTSSASSPLVKQRFEQRPSAQFRMYPQRVLGSPFYFSLESSASHLKTTGIVAGPNADYGRFDVFPTLSLQVRTPAWFSIKPQISARDTRYSAQLDDASIANPFATQTAEKKTLDRRYAQGQVEFVGPSFSRIFNRKVGAFTRFKHVIEPRVRYVYTSSVNDQERVIRFDTVDTPLLPIVRDSVEYSITQRLIGKEAGPNASPREVLSFSLRQTASLSKAFTSSTSGGLAGSSSSTLTANKFTPLLASLHVNPYQSVTLDAQATFGNVSHQIDQTSLSGNLIGTGKLSDKYLGFTWFATFRQPLETGTPGVVQQTPGSSQIRLNTGSSILRDKLRADVSINYDARTGQFLEQRYLFGFNASCWGTALEYRRYFTFDRGYIPTFSIAITLKNVGTIGTH